MKVTRFKKAIAWSLQIILAMVFLTVGMAKISGVQSSVDMFHKLGMGQWFRYVTGALELTSAVFLLFGPYASLGAGILMITMVGAIMAHLWLIGGSILPALTLFMVSGVVLYLRKEIRRSEEIKIIHEDIRRKSA